MPYPRSEVVGYKYVVYIDIFQSFLFHIQVQTRTESVTYIIKGKSYSVVQFGFMREMNAGCGSI